MNQFIKPTLLLNEDRAKSNIRRMAAKARQNDLQFRPHFKTHQSQTIGRWFRNAGVKTITVSSVDMAEYFARDGWNDITIAMPVNLSDIDRLNHMAKQIDLHLLVDSLSAVAYLTEHLRSQVQIWIEIDVGYHRCGLLWYNTEEVIELAQKIQSAEKMNFRGILTHAGHTYHQSSVDEVLRIHTESIIRLVDLKRDILDSGISACSISIGDTPGCSLANNFTGVDEIRPGNFVFYDLMQLWLNACRYSDIAVAVTCPVIGKYPNRGEIVVHCGSVHLSKEQLTSSVGTIYGYLVPTTADGWGPPDSSAPVIALSQEHGTIQMTKDMMQHVAIGDLVTILPVHSCLTANLYSEYHTINGKSISKMQSMV